jgi:hypothetical protein
MNGSKMMSIWLGAILVSFYIALAAINRSRMSDPHLSFERTETLEPPGRGGISHVKRLRKSQSKVCDRSDPNQRWRVLRHRDRSCQAIAHARDVSPSQALAGPFYVCFLFGSMGPEMPRYRGMEEPDDLWTVWDGLKEEPATIDGRPLIGLTHHRAEAARDILERIETRKLIPRSKHEI